MVANELTCDDVLDAKRDIAFPQSVLDLLSGRMGQTVGGFPKKVTERILRGEKPLSGRAGSSLPPADFEQAAAKVAALLDRDPNAREVCSYLLYPKVYEEFARRQQKYSDVSDLPTPTFFNGLEPGEETTVDIEPGKTLIIKFLTVGEPHHDGTRSVFFELNGQPRSVTVVDNTLEVETSRVRKADPANPLHVGSSMPGMVVTVAVRPGDSIVQGQKLLTLEAMKMQTTIVAERDAKIAEVLVKSGIQVEAGDLLVTRSRSLELSRLLTRIHVPIGGTVRGKRRLILPSFHITLPAFPRRLYRGGGTYLSGLTYN